MLSANKLKSTSKGSNRTDSSSSQECQIISPDRTGTTGKDTGSNRTNSKSSQECQIISQTEQELQVATGLVVVAARSARLFLQTETELQVKKQVAIVLAVIATRSARQNRNYR